MTMEIRQVAEITDDVTGAFARLIPQLSPLLHIPSAGELQAVVESGHAALFAAFADEEIAGVLTLAWYDVPSGRKAWIEDVVVADVYRGLGAGEALVHAAVEYASGIGALRVQLTSNPARRAAHALYRKCGFEEAETSVFVCKTDKRK